ncbi:MULTISPECIES: type IV secretion system protein TraC [Stenotrophomonas]|uniref:type IV secretion system protein TraC n=1 Tax=Stenotrophomonas TaxID=40323 RepID=UPI0021C73830|nr:MULTISPECIES: type IV secretion system protein TraC [Stenotrophomonas]MCU1136983.1 type IV secretion system protein TraC [Stenotrophomonas maltophilia]MEC4339693.1 type IV secretion system protein TraC [Stenotrophomonas pavanii]
MERTDLQLQMLGCVHAFDEDETLFLIDPQKIGFGVLVAPISGGDENIAEKLNLLLQLGWPADTLIQFTLYASPDLVGITSAYKDLRRNVRDPGLQGITNAHHDYLSGGAFTPVDKNTGVRLRDTRVAITVQVPFKDHQPTAQEMRQVKDLRVAFDAALKSAGIRGEKMTPKVYIRLMETILNQGADSCWKRSPVVGYDDKELICGQIIDPGNVIDVDDKGLWLNGTTRVRVLSPKRYPDLLYFGLAMKYLTDPKQGARGIRENAIVTLCVHMPDAEASRAKMEKEQMWANHQSSTPIAKYVSYFRDKKASYDAVLDQVKKGDRIVNAYISMAIFTQGEGDDEQSRALTEERSVAASINAQSYWREFGFHMMEDRYMVAPFFSQMLPFAADADMRKALERYMTMSARHATYLMPIFGQWRGTGTPLMTLFARDGQIQPISPFDTDSNMNFMIAALSGSGKSVLAQSLVTAFRTIQGRAWVIDVGDSYVNTCEMLGGQYLEFGKDSRVCINPFTLVRDYDEEADMLSGILSIMIAPTEGLSDFRLAELKRTLKDCWNQHGTALTIDILASALQESDRQEVKDMGRQLFSFTSAGDYGSYFAGPNNVNVDNPFTVLELGALKAKQHLQRVVLLTLMYQISQAVYMGDRATRQMLMIDEAWQLLASDETAEFVERAYRQFRKHNATVGIITQSVEDVWSTKGGRAIAENSAHMYLLRQKPESIDAIKRDSKLPFGDWGYEMLKTVHTVQGEYSEIMCITPFGVGIGRLILNDFQKLMFSTKPEDVTAVKRKREAGLNLAEAISAVIVDRTGGTSSSKQLARAA